jgi:hypothetical protein
MPSKWFQVSDAYKVVENVAKIDSEPIDVDGLCDAIKVKLNVSPKLQMVVYSHNPQVYSYKKPQPTTHNLPHLEPSFTVSKV